MADPKCNKKSRLNTWSWTEPQYLLVVDYMMCIFEMHPEIQAPISYTVLCDWATTDSWRRDIIENWSVTSAQGQIVDYVQCFITYWEISTKFKYKWREYAKEKNNYSLFIGPEIFISFP